MLEVLYEDNHFIAINKRCGELVQSDKTGDEPLEEKVKQYIRNKYDKSGNVFLGVTHRIDRPVSGVVLFARTSKALSRINNLFQEKKVKKTYLAIVQQCPPDKAATLEHYIRRNEQKNKSYVFATEVKNSRKAILHYKLLSQSDRYYLLEIDLETGRHHQIRCQLAAIGCPIRGDLKYGYPRSNENGGIDLHSYKIAFIHPVTHLPIEITAPVPDDKLWNFFAKNVGLVSSVSKRM
ncbi:MAG: RluA family pseudouridine synthase [Bacteroidales bacterium]|nr:RluA family pseudouridine synthase [Bacteroidales bacterium]